MNRYRPLPFLLVFDFAVHTHTPSVSTWAVAASMFILFALLSEAVRVALARRRQVLRRPGNEDADMPLVDDSPLGARMVRALISTSRV
jgi:hypothetical protein